MQMYHWYRTPAAVERIHARAVTMEMVVGENLPPEPPADERDRTVAGVDANANGVRDDVELEIHRRHADFAKIRAAHFSTPWRSKASSRMCLVKRHWSRRCRRVEEEPVAYEALIKLMTVCYLINQLMSGHGRN